jgi:two-component system sensor histidine kinase MprB
VTSWLRRKSFRVRLSALVAAAVGVTLALAALASYFAVRHQLYSQVDSSLQNELAFAQRLTSPDGSIDTGEAGRVLSRFNNSILQVVTPDGRAARIGGSPTSPLPVNSADARLALGNNQAVRLGTITFQGADYRVLTWGGGLIDTATGNPVAVQIARPLTDVEHTLRDLRLILWIVGLAGIGVAVALGYLVGKATIRPVERLTKAAEHVAATQDLESTIEDRGEDELARLARSFNAMLAALAASRQQQAQLISDAGHELRTPLTSLRTNIEVLLRVKDLPEPDRAELLKDVNSQLEEMTTLVGDVVELAREDEAQPEPIEVRLDAIVERAVERARRRASAMTFDVELTAGSVRAQPVLLERAVLNVLDNAVKWSPPGGTIRVRLQRHQVWTLDILDQGPGISAADLPHVFERFYRAATARSLPGSGLGLAIVQQVVASHGGRVQVASPPEGGTLVRIELPIVAEHELAEVASEPEGRAEAEAAPSEPDHVPAFAPDTADAWPAQPQTVPDSAPGPNPYGEPAAPWNPDEHAPAQGAPARFPWPTRRS